MYEKVSPNLMVPDVDAACRFYGDLGFTQLTRVPAEGGTGDFAIMGSGDVQVMLQSRESMATDLPPVAEKEYGGGCVVYLSVTGIEALHEKVSAVAEVVVPMRQTFYGSTEFYIEDPNGYIVGFAEHGSAG